ncbi:DNA cytosine methyltransferase [Lapidilactobacillus wuchangensis]|uniref:DNA cytosine methyltransferase n=1 Tax=Lapidilactobacillus wuchangensis TaxID=2486001 RepID=UPI000F7ADE59|nr:DNA cytosine methyltransferase [Lapidilactobacillus wuchangensis]
MNIIDLFSGAGGLTEGFRTNEFNILNHVEMDIAAAETLKLRDAYYYLKNNNKLDLYCQYLTKKINHDQLFSNIPLDQQNKTLNQEINSDTIAGIFSTIDDEIAKNNIKNIDGIIGGPPCQAYSTVGRARNKSKKDSDERIYLYRYYIEFLKKYRPKFFIFENVKGLLSFKDQFDEPLLPKMISEFNEAGYHLEKQIIDSSKYGVPQKRERLIIFGTDGSIEPSEFFKELNTLHETPNTVGELFQDLPELHSGQEVNSYSNRKPSKFVQANIRKTAEVPLTQNIARPNQPNDLEIYKLIADAKNKGINLHYNELDKKYQTHKNKHSFLDRYKALDSNAVSHTLVAHICKDGHYYIHPDVKQNRSITVREAARIQTFPDNFYFETSRTSAFKQIGNAVPPYLSHKFSKAILNLYK